MSAAIQIHGVRNYLRTKHGWDYKHCGIQPRAEPPNNAGPFYVAIDDAGVSTGPEDSNYLKEFANIVVGIWRRPGGLALDMIGNLQMPDDTYLANALTIADLERKVVVGKLGGLHQNWEIWKFVNLHFGLPHDILGAEFRGALVYQGRGGMEGLALENSPDNAFYGYKLRFRGMMRLQDNQGTIG